MSLIKIRKLPHRAHRQRLCDSPSTEALCDFSTMSKKELNRFLLSLKNSNDPKEALSICDEALDTFAKNYQIHCFAGRSAKQLNDIPLALVYLGRATELSPEQETAWQVLEEIYGAQHLAHAGTSAQEATDDQWIDTLKKWAACAAKKRKIKVKLGKALMQCHTPERRREAFDLWHTLLATSKNDNMLKVPLLIVFDMTINSPLVDNEETDVALLTYGTSALRMDVIEQYLEYKARTETESNEQKNEGTHSLEKILARYVGEALSKTNMDELTTTLKQCDLFIQKHDVDQKVLVAFDEEAAEEEEKESALPPILLERLLLNNVVPMATCLSCCNTGFDGTNGSSGGGNSAVVNIAKRLVRLYPTRPLGHLYLSQHLSLSSSGNHVVVASDEKNGLIRQR